MKGLFSGINTIKPGSKKEKLNALPAPLLSEDILGPGGHDDDLSLGRGHADLHAAVAILGQLSISRVVQVG